jgi:hypothetical protein
LIVAAAVACRVIGYQTPCRSGVSKCASSRGKQKPSGAAHENNFGSFYKADLTLGEWENIFHKIFSWVPVILFRLPFTQMLL